MLVVGDCLEVMAGMDAASVDAIVTDPPYGLGFMGKGWDSFAAERAEGSRGGTNDKGMLPGYGRGGTSADRFKSRQREAHAFQQAMAPWAEECLRVLKPGGHLLAFGGTRTYHRLACAVEDAGFEIRDCLAWLYGSGFPKSLDVSKAIDKAAGAERSVVGQKWAERYPNGPGGNTFSVGADPDGSRVGPQPLTAPATLEAQQWSGWGTALKPAHEPVVVARKPLVGTVAANVLAFGTGAVNVDGCRVGYRSEADERESKEKNRHADFGSGPRENRVFGADERDRGASGNYDPPGRWPANVLLDPEAAALLDEQTGELTSGANPRRRGADTTRAAYGEFGGQEKCAAPRGIDSGGASRFFYVAKASSRERNAGLDGFEEKAARVALGPATQKECVVCGHRFIGSDGFPTCGHGEFRYVGQVNAPRKNVHPTVKPIALMRWLVRLVTPPGGVVLDPFAGSGTTGCACALEGFEFVGVEREPEYVEIANARIAWWASQRDDQEVLF